MKTGISLIIMTMSLISISFAVLEPDTWAGRPVGAESGCASKDAAGTAACRMVEEKLLSATARIVLKTGIVQVEGTGYMRLEGNGHATVIAGRYLVSHNHFGDQLVSMLLKRAKPEYIVATIYDAHGNRRLKVSSEHFHVEVVDRETLVFDFGQEGDPRPFVDLGFSSVEAVGASDLPLRAGMQVAQVDWDAQAAHIDWSTVISITTYDETPILKLANCLEPGASGGGVFWNGLHIANNWSRSGDCGPAAASGIDDFSHAALNSSAVAGLWTTNRGP